MSKKAPAKNIIILITLLACIFITGCGQKSSMPFSKTGFYFDTVVTITVYEKENASDRADELIDQTMDECSRLEKMLSPAIEGSDVWNINHSNGEWVYVSDETATLIYTALTFCRTTNGKADITIAPAKNLWTFDGSSAGMPDASALSQALSHVDYNNVITEGTRVRLKDPEAMIDLGFIAKGYIADQLKSFLIANNAEAAIINLGGNVQTLGLKPGNSAFSVGIQKPFAEIGQYSTKIELGDDKSDKGLRSSAVTSGIYERYFESDGRIYHHILDPFTGMPANTDLYSATILADSSMEADALSTICILMGKEEAEKYIRSLDEIDAIFITSDGQIIDT
ncbi:MAG: FAD:protein FMN transferase, partial [Lachnospiraceae bacterium]|nr:FAD:protein FMN transferase [Lachnospiraceae bacterium]